MKILTCILTFILCGIGYSTGQTVLPGHSHNDYEQDRPLQLALESRMRSVEIDVHLVKGELLVAHDADKVDPRKTIQTLYLDPLVKRAESQGGRVYPGNEELILLIDFKTEAESTYQQLQQVLWDYRSLLTSFGDGKTATNAVRVVVSGNRPIQSMSKQRSRLAFVDGRTSNLDSNESPDLMPLISDNWNVHFTWNGDGSMPGQEFNKMEELVNRAHAQGKWIRFWAAPDNEASWAIQRKAGCDLINTDKPSRLRAFFENERSEE